MPLTIPAGTTISPILEFFTSQGVPLETSVLLLMLPLIATFIAFLRQVVGVKAFGIYTPSIVTFAFFAMGIKYAAIIFITIILVGMLTRTLIRGVRVLYLSRVAIMLIVVTLTMLAILAVGGSFQRTGFAKVEIFPLLIMITIVEKFVATQIEKGDKAALLMALETLIIASLGYFIISSPTVIGFIAAFPSIILLAVPVNLILGRWTGLRLVEYYRFREILKSVK